MNRFRSVVPKPKAILAIIALCSIALASGIPIRFRVDLTDNGRYTLSPYAREVLSALDSEVKVTWYRSRDIGHIADNWREIEGCLHDFRSASRGRFTYEIRDPSSSDVLIDPESLGIQGTGDTNEYYSGLLVEHNGKSDVIPFVADRSKLEYDLLVRIVSLSAKNTAGVQVLFASPGGSADCPYVIPWLEYSRFTVRELALPARDIDASELLIVIGSTNVDPATAKAIDAFLDSGGNAAFFVSGVTVATDGNWDAASKVDDGLLALLSRRGIIVDDGIVMDESCWRMTLPSIDGTNYEMIDYPYWARVILKSGASRASRASAASTERLLSGIGSLQFYWPSDILIDTSKDGGLKPVVQSSDAAIVDVAPFVTDPFGKGIDRLRSRAGKSRRHLAVASETGGRLVCVADELFPGTMGDYTASDANLDFLVNCAEWLAGKDGLISVKKTWPFASAPTAGEIGAMTSFYRKIRVALFALMPSIVAVACAIALLIRKKRRG